MPPRRRSSAYKNYNENSEDYDLKPSAYTRTNSNNNAGASSSRRRRAVEPKSPSPAQDPVIETMGSDGSGEGGSSTLWGYSVVGYIRMLIFLRRYGSLRR